jgi:hypothetical protein
MEEHPEPRQERRERKRQAERDKMDKHGKGLAQMYKDAVAKRLGENKDKPKDQD